jgi:hypothetical protein
MVGESLTDPLNDPSFLAQSFFPVLQACYGNERTAKFCVEVLECSRRLPPALGEEF